MGQTVTSGCVSWTSDAHPYDAGGFPPHPPSVRTGHLPLKGKANKVRANSESYLAQWAPPLRFVRFAGDAAAWDPAEEDTRFVTFSRFP